MKRKWTLLHALLLALSLVLTGCQGDEGPAGNPGMDGEPGIPGGQGPVGQTGTTGGTISDPFQVANFHGAAYTAEGTRGANNSANLCTDITKAVVNSAGKLVIDFTVTSMGADKVCGTGDDTPYTGLTNTSPTATGTTSTITFRFAQLRPAVSGDTSYWVNYINVKARKIPGFGFAQYTGLELNQPTGEGSNTTGGDWKEMGSGTYRYTTNKVLTSGIDVRAFSNYSARLPNRGVYPYDATLPHRVAIQVADHDGPRGPALHGANNPIYDFIPGPTGNGAEMTDPREVVVLSNCNECHGTLGLHGGGRLDPKLCVVCHNPTAGDPESGNTLDLKVMIHKIHSAKYLPSVNFDFAGDSGGMYNDLLHVTPTTTDDPEAAIKGTPYKIWGFNNTEFDFSEIVLPANPANCLKCHKNAADGNNYKTKPTKEACGSCHDGIDFSKASGTNAGRRMWFPASKITFLNGTSAGALRLGHLGGIQNTNNDCATTCHTATGPQPTVDKDPAPVTGTHGDFGKPALVSNGWSKIQTDYTVDLTITDQNDNVKPYYSAGDKPRVHVVIKEGGVAIKHTTVTEDNFGTASLYVYGPTALKKPVLTTSALLPTFAVNTSVNKDSIDVQGGVRRVVPLNTASNKLMLMTLPTSLPYQDDYGVPVTKLTGVIPRTDTEITYQLSDVTGLPSGTYQVFVHIQKKNTTNSITIGTASFQIGPVAPDKKIAECTKCHEYTMWHDSPAVALGNHPAFFDPDQCAACHDYAVTQPPRYGTPDGKTPTYIWKGGPRGKTANNLGFGAAPISRRVHGVHFGKRADGTAGVTYPFEIYNGHNVAITFPQDVRNCETTCHTAATGGTWKTNPNRVACLACHDSDATTAHGAVNTVDPTPTVTTSYDWTPGAGPYGGGEQESCPVCHKP